MRRVKAWSGGDACVGRDEGMYVVLLDVGGSFGDKDDEEIGEK